MTVPHHENMAALPRLAKRLLDSNLIVSTAESCTGGGLAYALTSVPGSSRFFHRGVVTYSNASKTELLGVDPALFDRHGAVSAAVVGAMLDGLTTRTEADLLVAISGIAGPGGGSDAKPVGTVFIGVRHRSRPRQQQIIRHQFGGDRARVREASINAALLMLGKAILGED